MKNRKIKGLIISIAFCVAVFIVPIAHANNMSPYSIDNLENFLANKTYFNGNSTLISSFDFSGTWQYTAIASEARHENGTIIDPLSTAAAASFKNTATDNWGAWQSINFDSGNIYLKDFSTGYMKSVDGFNASDDYLQLYLLTADSQYLDYLGKPITLSAGTYILGFNDNGSDKDYDDFIIALQPGRQQVPEPVTMLLLGLGLVGLAGVRRKFKK